VTKKNIRRVMLHGRLEIDNTFVITNAHGVTISRSMSYMNLKSSIEVSAAFVETNRRSKEKITAPTVSM